MEAMRQQLEILSSMQMENEKKFGQNSQELTRKFDEVTRKFDEVTRKFDQVTRNFEICLDSIKRLERIALSHEVRIDDIQQRLNDLERRSPKN